MPRLAESPAPAAEESDEEMVDAKVDNADDEVDHKDQDEEDDVEGGDDEDDEEADVYTIETILAHRFEKNKLFFQIRWEGYPDEEDFTWEPEDNCDGAPEAVATYFESIGGRPEPAPKGNGRGRKSLNSTPAVASAKKATPKAAKEDVTTPKSDKWKPPNGSWEDEIRCIDNLEKGGPTAKDLMCYVHWNNGRKTQHPAHVVYKQCPQKMLQFYEKHLVFRDSDN